MIDINKFSQLQKSSSHSFNQHKLLIKKLMAGQKVLCHQCHQALRLNLPSKHNKVNTSGSAKSTLDNISNITCAKGCTDIQLDVSP